MENIRHGAEALRILITAGGTSESIDNVRRITNSGTGRLGALIAEAFLKSGRDCHIAYLCSSGAVKPCVSGEIPGENGSRVKFCIADDVSSVRDTVCRICSETSFDIIIHSMAIGDYLVRAVSDAERMTGGVIERLSALARGDSSRPEEAVRAALLSPPGIRESKISSDKENLIVVLEKAPKVIALYRGLAPGAVIVGFKLLSDANEDELVQAAMALLTKNDCDFALANDMQTVRAERHEGLLVAKDGTFERASGKADIAALIVKRTLAYISSNGDSVISVGSFV